MTYEPFRHSTPSPPHPPPTITTTAYVPPPLVPPPPQNPFASHPSSRSSSPVPNRPRPPPQSYEDFRATGKSIELHDATDIPRPLPRGGTMRAQFPGKAMWAKVRLLLRGFSLLCSALTGSLMLTVLVTYFKTKDLRYKEEMLWPRDPRLVPVWYMMIAAAATILIHIGLIISHFYDRSYYYTEALTKRDKVSSIIQAFLGLTWIVGGFLARLYTKEKYGEGNDLWTWSCNAAWHSYATGDGIGLTTLVNFSRVCSQIRGGYYSAYFNALLEFISVMTFTINQCLARRKGYQYQPGGPHY